MASAAVSSARVAAGKLTLVHSALRSRVLHVQLRSPNNLNALSAAMISELSAALDRERLSQASVVLISAEGRHFCAGHDLAEMTGDDYDPAIFRQCSDMMQRVATCELPVVAAVQGCAFAAGCQLAASCDMVIAADSARFSTPGVRIGLFCHTPSVALTRSVSDKVAADMLFTARQLTAQEAHQVGLVSCVVQGDAQDVLDEALRTCQLIAGAPRDVLVSGKRSLLAQRGRGLTEAYDVTSEAMVCGMRSPSATIGIGAFLNKENTPRWPAEEYEIRRALALVPEGVAVVGASPKASRDSFKVFRAIRRAGGPAYPVNPTVSDVDGVGCYSKLTDVGASIGLVNIFRSGDAIAEAIDEAIALAPRGVRGVWLQLGVRAPEAEARARAAGLICVADRCLMVEMERFPSDGQQAGKGGGDGSSRLSPPQAKL